MDAVKAPKWVWAALVVVIAGSIGVSWKTSHDTRDTNDCLVSYIAENSRVSKIRAAATMKREQAVTDLLDGIAKITLAERPEDPAKAAAQQARTTARYRQYLGEYQRATAEVAAERANNPLPNLPDNCDEAN